MDKDKLQRKFEKRKEYKELLSFIEKYDNLEIIVKKQFCGIEDIFYITRKLNISTSTLTDILYELIQLNESDIDECINENLGDKNE